jgi:putative acetyltransferase
MSIAIAQERADSPDAQALVIELDSFLTPLYPGESHHGYSVEKLIAQGVAFFVLRYDGAAAACGGVQFFGQESGEESGEEFGEEFGEIKRMYVRPAFRGRGLSKAMLAHLESYTRSQGVDLLRLETGIYQTEAIGLYEQMGYTRTGPFGPYTDDPLSLLYAKRLRA